MKTTVLIYKDINAENKELRVATPKEWDEILKKNKGLPMEERRLFIKDCINDNGSLNCMFIEVPIDEYRKWHSEQEYLSQKQKDNEGYVIISLDAPVKDTNEADIKETISNGIDYEQLSIDNIVLEELRKELRGWKSWANDMLDLYLLGGSAMSASSLCKRFGLSDRGLRKRRRAFENKVLNFYKK